MPEEAENSHRCTYLRGKSKNIIRFIGSLFLPLLLAIFTVIITFEQRGEAYQQRMQDLNISREQREQDKWISENQREHDKKIADEKRAADDINAEKQRNMSRDQRKHELEVEQQRYEQEREKYLDNLLLSYYNEIGQSLKESNGTLSSNAIISAIARAKTLNVIDQVGPKKSVHLIKFLYDANQLSLGSNSLDLTNAQLNNVDLSSLPTLRNITFIGAHLNNASFFGKDLSNAYFLNVHLQQADFSHSNISFAFFKNVDLTKSTFKEANGVDMYFEYCRMEHVDFTEVRFGKSERPGAIARFIDSTLTWSIFRNAILPSIQFHFCNMTAVDFTNANLERADLTGSLLLSSLFINAQLENTNFLSTNLSSTDFRNCTCPSGRGFCTLSAAVSLENALLPIELNIKSPKSLIYYEQPQCNSSIDLPPTVMGAGKWLAHPKDSVFLQYRSLTNPNLHKSGCVFTAKSSNSTKVSLTHEIHLARYMGLVRARRAKATVRCRVGEDTHVFVGQMSSKQVEIVRSDGIGLRWQEILNNRTETVVIYVEFHFPQNWQSTWCLYVELYIESVINAPDYQLLYPWDSTNL